MGARDEVADFWDEVTREFFDGGRSHQRHPQLGTWFDRYRGSGDGKVTTDAFAEPYIGPLATRYGQPRLVTLGLNPGRPDIAYQGRGGIFQAEMESLGGYAAWAVTEPYLRSPWADAHPSNRYHERLRTFARRWLDDPNIASREILVLEMYPWHSISVTKPITAHPEILTRFVWDAVAECDTPIVFGFGQDWAAAAPALGLEEVTVEHRFSVDSRRLKSFRLPSGQHLVVTWQQGYAGPPGLADIPAFRAALNGAVRPNTQSSGEAAPRASSASQCVHELPAGTCALCAPATSRQRLPRVRPGESGTSALTAYKTALAEAATPRLRRLGAGSARVTANYVPIRWPTNLWYRQHTQNGDLHVFVYADHIAVRVHIDTFSGDRPRNEAAFDLVREAVEGDLLRRLPPGSSEPDWRAARGGNNQVCAITHPGGVDANRPGKDADWVASVVGAWLETLRANPLPDLRTRAEQRLCGEGE
jgi:hypothetical protein